MKRIVLLVAMIFAFVSIIPTTLAYEGSQESVLQANELETDVEVAAIPDDEEEEEEGKEEEPEEEEEEEETTPPAEEPKQPKEEGGDLPETSTPYPTYLLVGTAFLIVGIAFLSFIRRQTR